MTRGSVTYLWLIPVCAVLIGMALFLWSAADPGPSITISFADAEGLDSGLTPVRFRDVEVGTVTAVRLSPDHTHVLASVQLRKVAAGLAVKDTRFWIVRPRMGARDISGIGTLISGSYVDIDVGVSKETASTFTGLESPPTVPLAKEGGRYVLHASSLGSVGVGAPVYYKRLDVGRVTSTSLDADGKGVSIEVFVDAPYHRYIGPGTRWWDAGGADLWLDERGIAFHMQSISAMLLGAVAFQTSSESIGNGATACTTFELEQDARAAEGPPAGTPAVVVMRFAQSLRGLSAGAVVDFRGLPIGEVTNVSIDRSVGNQQHSMIVTMNLYPDRLGQQFRQSIEHADVAAGKELLRKLVGDGLRGQLRTGNLLTNQLYVALDLFPNAAPVPLDLSRSPIALPTIPNALDDLQAEIVQITRTLNGAAFGPVGTELSQSFARARRLFEAADTQLAPQVRETLATAKQIFDKAEIELDTSPSLQSHLPVVEEHLTRAQRALGTLSDTIEQRPETIIWGRTPAP